MKALLGSLGIATVTLGAAACAHRAPMSNVDRMEAQGVQLAVQPTLVEQVSHTTALLQAVSAVSDSVAWVSGHRATWARTTDGGATWLAGAMAGPDSTLEFRDVHAVDANTAYLLSAGNGAASRIYKTTDGGRIWQLQFMNQDSAAFFDCFDFWDAKHGVAVSDAVRGRLVIIRTDDGGAHWNRVPDDGIPPALEGEGAFAASGTCLVAQGRSVAWIGTGSTAAARVFKTTDRGRHWSVMSTPVVSGQSAGIETVAFRDALRGIALGGRIADANDRSDNVAVTGDGGLTWYLAGRPTISGAIYGSSFVPGVGPVVVAVSPKGMDWSSDGGRTWANINANAYWSVGFSSRWAGWAVGPRGRITHLAFGPIMVN